MLAAGCGPADGDGEHLRGDEAVQAEAAAANFRQLIETYRQGPARRGAHAKAHACVPAWFTVNTDIDADLRYGVLAAPGRRYRAWIRFSNGHFDPAASQDFRDDARGMAVKLLEPPGQPLQQAPAGPPAQDFLMTNSPVFFIRDIGAYNRLVAAPEDFTGFFFPGWNPARWRLKELLRAAQTLTGAPDSPLAARYFSITAYRLGPHRVKFGARPCEGNYAGPPPDRSDPDFLSRALSRDLAAGPACFHFEIQRQVPDRGLSVEDPTVEWPEDIAPFEPAAGISIPGNGRAGEVDPAFCENLAFAPWHALEAHRPLGQFNRLRRHVYPASSEYRHRENQAPWPDPLAAWCRAVPGSC